MKKQLKFKISNLFLPKNQRLTNYKKSKRSPKVKTRLKPRKLRIARRLLLRSSERFK